MYIVFPLIIGFVGERYKDMSTVKYAVFITGIFIAAYVTIVLIDGGSFIPEKFFIKLFSFGVIIITAFFHLQKRLRGVK